MLQRKDELIAKLDQLIELEGWKESLSDISIPVVVHGFDKISDGFPPAVQEGLNSVLAGWLDGQYDQVQTKDGDPGQGPKDPRP